MTINSDKTDVQLGKDWRLGRCSSPHSMLWENSGNTKGYRLKRGSIFVLTLGAYLVGCVFCVCIVKFLLAQLKFHFYFGPTCPEISDMFTSNEEYLSYAAFDKQYLPKA